MWNAKALRNIMKTRSISAAQLAEKTGLSNSSISLWVNAKQTPSDKAITKLADALGVSVSDFSKPDTKQDSKTDKSNIKNAPEKRCIAFRYSHKRQI